MPIDPSAKVVTPRSRLPAFAAESRLRPAPEVAASVAKVPEVVAVSKLPTEVAASISAVVLLKSVRGVSAKLAAA